ncbi:GxxExxY protein [Desulfonatronum parangueonense]
MANMQLTSQIINAAIAVHQELGPGLLENVYLKCLSMELKDRGLTTLSEVDLPVVYKGQYIQGFGYRLDLLVEDEVIVELKSVQHVEPIHKKQLLSYLRLSRKEVGLLINFNEVLLKNGITRIINSTKDDGTTHSARSGPRDAEGTEREEIIWP